MEQSEVVIAGGGMVGLTLAVALGRAGVPTTVVEPLAADAQLDGGFDGRVSAIAAGSQAILAALDLWPALAADAEPIREIRVSDGASPLHLHYDRREVAAPALGYIVENRLIRRALIAAAGRLDAVRLVTGRTVAGVAPGPVATAARLDDGNAISARLAVAADGRRSPLRRAAGIGCVEWGYGQIGIVCTVAHERDHRGIAQERFLPAGPFAILPMTGRRSSIVWTERAATARRILALAPAAFAAELARRFTGYLGALRVEGPVFSYPLSLTLAERYAAPRLALIGDAAHAIHPIAGQGLNLGLRDVAALAEVVVDAARLGLDPGAPDVLARYGRRRRADNLAMLAATDGLNRLFSNDVPPVRLARRLGLAAVDRTGALKRLFMRHAMGEIGDRPRLARGLPL